MLLRRCGEANRPLDATITRMEDESSAEEQDEEGDEEGEHEEITLPPGVRSLPCYPTTACCELATADTTSVREEKAGLEERLSRGRAKGEQGRAEQRTPWAGKVPCLLLGTTCRSSTAERVECGPKRSSITA